MTLIDLFKEFHRNATQQEYPPSSRVLYMTLLGEFNSARWPDSLVLSTRDLTQLTGLPTTSVHRAKQFLTSKGIIKCRPFKNKTAFSLPTEQSRNSNGTVTEQSRNTFENPNIHVREEDVKTLDVTAETATRARAPVNYDIDRLVDRWEKSEALCKLDMLIVAKLEVLLKSYTCDEILAAMDKAILSNDNHYGASYNFVETILKGGDTNVRVARQPARVRSDGHGRRNVVDFATGARQAGKGRFDDDEPDTAWIYEGQSSNGGDG